MSGTGGLFTTKIQLKSYFDNANGLREGAPVRLAGVDIGNVTKILVVHDRDQATHSGRSHDEGEYPLPVQPAQGFADLALHRGRAGRNLHRHRQFAGQAVRRSQDGDVLPSREVPDFGDMVRAGQGTLQNMDALLKRLDRIVAFVESGQGSVGKLLYDPTLYNRLNCDGE